MNGHGTPSALSAPLPPTRTTTTTTSCMNRFLSSMTLIALGAIGGFGIFHSALQYRIEQTELNHNATLAIVTSRFFESEKERNRCIETDDGRLQELSDLRGRLDAQHKSWYDLTAAQRSMVSKQKEHNAQMEQFRDVYERDQRALASLKAESDQKDRDLIAFHENLQKYRRTKVELESELTKLQKTKEGETLVLQVKMEHKDLKLGSLEENLNLLSNQKEQLERERHELQMRIQQQDEEFESLKKNSDTLQNQKRQLEHDVAVMRDTMSEMESKIVEKDNEVSEKERRIRQQDEELESFKKHSDTLQNQKRRLEHDVGVMRDKLDNMESQVVEKDKELSETDKELSEYREEEEELEKKIVNFREGMLGLLEEKIHEIQELENRVDLLKKEKVDLEMKLDNWREGMLDLVKEKMQEIDHLKAVLAESRTSMKAMMNEIEMARSEQVEAEEFVRERLVTIDRNSDSDTPEQKEMIQELLQEIELVRVALRESQEWLVEAKKEIEHRKSDQAESEELISEKMNEINDLKLQIERDEESANEKISELESDLAEAREAVKEKTNQIEHLKHLNSELQEIVMEINDLKSGASVEPNNILPGSTTSEMMIDHVQQRDGVMCRQLYVNNYTRDGRNCKNFESMGTPAADFCLENVVS
jgi:chromosome segregation ATPase